jgi:hypothetical protein
MAFMKRNKLLVFSFSFRGVVFFVISKESYFQRIKGL